MIIRSPRPIDVSPKERIDFWCGSVFGRELMPSTLRLVFRYAVSDGIPKRSFYVAMVVGTVLNLINQGEALFGASSINWTKLVLTYFVPYAVATYGAISYRLSQP
jgi:hypothetical protein